MMQDSFGAGLVISNSIANFINYYHALLFQVFLCFGNSVASTRFMLQDEFNIQTTQCDNCIIVLSLSLSHSPFLSTYTQLSLTHYGQIHMQIFNLMIFC